MDALSPYSPYLRGAPAGLPFRWDENTLRRGLNFTLTTSIGDLDLLGEVTGGGNFEALLAPSSPVQAFGIECLCLNFDKLIQVPIRVPPLGTQEVRAYMMLLYVDNSGLEANVKEEIRSKICKQLGCWSRVKEVKSARVSRDSESHGDDQIQQPEKIEDNRTPSTAGSLNGPGDPWRRDANDDVSNAVRKGPQRRGLSVRPKN